MNFFGIFFLNFGFTRIFTQNQGRLDLDQSGRIFDFFGFFWIFYADFFSVRKYSDFGWDCDFFYAELRVL